MFDVSQITHSDLGFYDDGECSRDEEEKCQRQIVSIDAKRALVGAGAWILFYPTLLYNVLRNQIEVEFRWWDHIDEVLLSLSLSLTHTHTHTHNPIFFRS